jgi:LysR family transcriptional regulator, regulator for genes of the gallate degradation pathway
MLARATVVMTIWIVAVIVMDVDLKHLLNLLAIARQGSFGRAATHLKVSQPALSNSVAQLERRIGKGRVLDRGRHGAKLTNLGELLLRHAEIIEMQVSRLGSEVEHYKCGTRGPLAVGVTPVAAARLVPQAIGRLLGEDPSIAVLIQEASYHEAASALLKGALDVVVGPIGVYPPVEQIEEEDLAVDPFALIVGNKHELARRQSISLKTLGDVRWVLPAEESAYRRQLEALFMFIGLPWPIQAVLTNSMSAMKAMVMNADCVAIMPIQLVATETDAGVLHAIRLAEAGATRHLGVSWSKDRKLSPIAARFRELLRECANERVRKGKS